MLIFILLGLTALALPFVVPIVLWLAHRQTRRDINLLADLVREQQKHIDSLWRNVHELRPSTAAQGAPSEVEGRAAVAAAPIAARAQTSQVTQPVATAADQAASVAPATKEAAQEAKEAARELRPVPQPASPPATLPQPAPLPPAPPPPPPVQPAAVSASSQEPPIPKPAAPPEPPRPTPALHQPAPAPISVSTPEKITPPSDAGQGAASPRRELPSPPRPPFTPPAPPAAPFDWESLIGVKLFSAIAGIALVVAAVFFLRYSIERGWLEPPVRVVIGIVVATALLVVCELKAARQYPTTANALDGAAIAILFATFFSAHALWKLIPASVTFALLALVTAVAVVLSIRRESLFIAVLGLLGGFSTPALLSTGENRPIPLFAYLLLLNVGLAWVAYTRRWPILAILSLVLTTLYQWGWVLKYLSVSQLSLAAGIFLLFPLVSFVGISLARPRRDESTGAEDRAFERTAVIAAALPLLFGLYLAAVPEYGPHAGILFGFLLLLDVGLLAIGVARGEELLHALSAAVTLLVFAIWLSSSYHADAYRTVLLLLVVFVSFFAGAPAAAAWFERPFKGIARSAIYAAPLLLVAPMALAATERGGSSPVLLFGVLFVLVALLGWRAVADGRGPVYFIAAFFAVAAQAVWSVAHLDLDRLPTALALYGAFGLLSFAVPVIARRTGRPLRPHYGAGVVLLASLALQLFLATGYTAPAALWGMALLIAILDAGLFVESAAERLPLVSIAGSVLSWFVLAVWWSRSAAVVGLLPSLLVIVLLALVMLGGHAWSYSRSTREPMPASILEGFRSGLFLGLVGHLFTIYIASNPAWSLPPWPMFGVLGVLTLAVSITSLYTRVHLLHGGGVVAAMIVLLVWSTTARMGPWPTIALIAGGGVAAFALAWMRITGTARAPSIAAGVTLFLMELVAIAAASQPGVPRLEVLIVSHAVTVAALLALIWRERWTWIAPLAVVPAWLAVVNWQVLHTDPDHWVGLLVFAGVLYAIFTAYPFVLGRRAGESRDPYITAVLAAAMFFFAARRSFTLGGLAWMMGAIPVFEGAILALLLRSLLRMQPREQRDLGRVALVAGAALAFVTVAIPLQLSHQWITIGWALEGAALAWLSSRIPHKGLLASAVGLLAVVFVRLALNPAIFEYEPRGSWRIFNWYLYTYAVCAAAFFASAWFLARTDDRLGIRDWRFMHVSATAGAILLFIVLNIEIADYYATGPEIMFRFGVTVAQDLTYTIGWLVFGMVMLAAGIYLESHAARVAALSLLAVTTFKAFLYDLGSLGGLYRVGSLVGLAVSLTLVSVALQRFVLRPAKPQ